MDMHRKAVARFAKQNTIVLTQEEKDGANVEDENELPLPTGSLLKEDNIRSWIKLLVEHFTASRILQHHCTRLEPGNVVNINVVTIKGPDQRDHPKVTWQDMKKVLTNVTDHQSSTWDDSERQAIKPEEVIQKLEQIANHASTDPDVSKSMKDLRCLINNKPLTLYAKLHCETLLLALIKFPDASIANILDVLKVSPITMFIYSLFIFFT
jgi:hypothetical protein